MLLACKLLFRLHSSLPHHCPDAWLLLCVDKISFRFLSETHTQLSNESKLEYGVRSLHFVCSDFLLLQYSKALRRLRKCKKLHAAVATSIPDEAAGDYKVERSVVEPRLCKEQHTDQRLIAALTTVGLPIPKWYNFTVKGLNNPSQIWHHPTGLIHL